MNTKQQLAFDLATKYRKNIFLTGPAGKGKSVVLKIIIKYLQENMRPCYDEESKELKRRWVATSSTGVSVVALGPCVQTLHSFTGYGVPEALKDFDKCWEILVPAKKRSKVEKQLNANSFFKDCIAEEHLALKVGAQVMLIKN